MNRECLPKDRQEHLELLQEIVSASPIVRVVLSGRPHIRGEIGRYFTKAMIAITPTIGDTERYLEMRLDRDTAPGATDNDLRAEIMRAIPRKFRKCG